MSNQAVMASPRTKLLVLSQTEFEQDIESRLRRLGRLVKDLAGSAYPLLVIETARIRAGLGELVVKEEAMRWIIGVAKHSDGAVQRKLLAHVANTLRELERTAESLPSHRWWDEDGHRWHPDRDWDDHDHDRP